MSILGYPVEPFTARKVINLKALFSSVGTVFYNLPRLMFAHSLLIHIMYLYTILQVECPCRKCQVQIEVDSLFQHIRDRHADNTVFTLVDE